MICVCVCVCQRFIRTILTKHQEAAYKTNVRVGLNKDVPNLNRKLLYSSDDILCEICDKWTNSMEIAIVSME